VDKSVDNLWISAGKTIQPRQARTPAHRKTHFHTSLSHFGADPTSSLYHFRTLAQKMPTPQKWTKVEKPNENDYHLHLKYFLKRY